MPGPAPAAIYFGTREPCQTGAGGLRGSASEGRKENTGHVHRVTPNPKARPRSAPQTPFGSSKPDPVRLLECRSDWLRENTGWVHHVTPNPKARPRSAVPSVFGIRVRLTFRFGQGCSGIAQEADGGKNGSAAATSAGHGPAGGLRIAAKKYFSTSRQEHRKGGARPRRGVSLRSCRRFDPLRAEVARTHRTAAGVGFFRKPLLASLVMY